MTFWTYILHCNGGFYYVGHTDDIQTRMWQHQNGVLSGFTRDHLPVKLVWSADFPTRDDAKAMEYRLKGWSRAKKMALIRGDFAELSRLAQNRTGVRQTQADGFWERQALKQKEAGLRLAHPGGATKTGKNICLPEPVEGQPSSPAPKPPE